MTRSKSGTRRAAMMLAGIATAAATGMLLTGCGTGQIAETAQKATSIGGVNTELQTAGGSFKVRNLAVDFAEDGYAAGDDAPLELGIFNDTGEPVTVRITSESARSVRLVGSGSSTAAPAPTATASPAPGATATPTAAPTSAAPAGVPAVIQLPPNGFMILNRIAGPHLVLAGLNEDLNFGDSVNLIFDFNGEQLRTAADIAVPLTPVPRAPGIPGEHEEANVAPEQHE